MGSSSCYWTLSRHDETLLPTRNRSCQNREPGDATCHSDNSRVAMPTLSILAIKHYHINTCRCDLVYSECCHYYVSSPACVICLCAHRLLAMTREARVKELEVLDAARRKFMAYTQQQKEAELARLDDEIRRKVC